jgi:hypothetical protein
MDQDGATPSLAREMAGYLSVVAIVAALPDLTDAPHRRATGGPALGDHRSSGPAALRCGA